MLRLMANPSAATSRHDKLYILAQGVGWGGFTLAYFGLAQLNKGLTLNQACVFVATNITGFLLSHLYRVWINRRGWKQLGWPALLVRVVLGTLALSVLWTLVTWPLFNLIENHELKNLSLTAIFVYSVFNGVWIYSLWSLLYFGYHIADRYRRSEVERAQLTATVKEAELRALKSQVNPHFIFNALNSLRALIDEDPARARLAVTQLANLLRYSLQSGQLETVPFEDELRIVNDYLALEQVRHEERLRLRLDVAPETLHLPVPPMLLQTLVENAVKYGISQRTEGGEIAIIARCEGGNLRLQVTNPGELTPAPARGLARPLNGSTGVGLRNAAERLRLLFGESALLQLRAESPATVVAEARIPLTTVKAVPVVP
jgi:two-component system LytT family sensor kinase